MVFIEYFAYTKNIHLSRLINFAVGCLPFYYARVTMRNSLLLLTFLPAGIDLLSVPATGWHLCCSLATPSIPLSSSLRQGGGFETPQNQTLQAQYR